MHYKLWSFKNLYELLKHHESFGSFQTILEVWENLEKKEEHCRSFSMYFVLIPLKLQILFKEITLLTI